MALGTNFKSQISSTLGGGGGGGSGCDKGTIYNMSSIENQNGETNIIIGDLNHHDIGKPPRDHSIIRQSSINLWLDNKSELDIANIIEEKSEYTPILRSGSCSEKGPKQYMEDEFICVDILQELFLASELAFPSPAGFYGVFDGHGGTDAASYTKTNILKLIIEDPHFPSNIEKAIKSAFVKIDNAFADATSLDSSSGTTALIALIWGRDMIIANVGDSRAVLGKRGRAIELSKDHKPNSSSERERIEKLGGVIYDGYLNGQLSVARAVGDWHIKGYKGAKSPLSSEPEIEDVVLREEDEFLIMGCDGLWDVMSSQGAVTMVRRELMEHNDPMECAKALVSEALQRNACDNLTVVVICFSKDAPPKIEKSRVHRRRSISAEGIDILKGLIDGI